MTRSPLHYLALVLLLAGCSDASSPDAAPDPDAATSGVTPPPTPRRADKRPDTVAVTKAYSKLLAEVVTSDGLVRYDELRKPERLARLDAAVRDFEKVAIPANRDKRLAVWCNAYNANVLAFAVRDSAKPGFTGVDKVDGFFKKRKIKVAGEILTLDKLENDRIRPHGDPRTHAALVCAAMSCPPLRSEAFIPEKLDAQLDDQCRRWVNDPTKFTVKDGTLGLSRILEWYGKDFDIKPYTNATGFVTAFAESGGPIARYVIDAPSIRTTFLPYDWSLNQAR
ncbi:MAG: DUF547 domain-containing protein [Planctomycetota bacterium]|jgi:hypothetical protein